MSISGLLFVAFVVLKLCHVIDWSWWWVTSPIWIGIPIGIFFLFLAAILKAIAGSVR